MVGNPHGLILNNKIYPIDSLKVLCSEVKEDSVAPDWKKNVFAFIAEWINEDEFIHQESSGTTGKKKLLKLSKKSMVESARKTCEYFNVRFGQSVLLCLPIDYIAGKMMIVRAFVGGLNLLMTEPSSMPQLEGFGTIDFCAMVPLQTYNSLNSVDALRRIKKLIIGGGEIRDELEMMLRDMPNEVYATYGMAETCSHVAIRRISGSEHARYYNAIPGVKFALDKRNCLAISSDFLDEDVVTNDVVDLINESTFRWIGRYDNLINSGGLKIVPEELEAVISKASGLDCSVIGLPDKKLGEKVVLVVEQGGSEVTEIGIRNVVESELPANMQPKQILFVKELPRNHSYKVDRNKLKRQLTSEK